MSDNPDRLSKEEHARVFRERVLPNAELDKFTPQDRPRAIILAGQPGAGKWSLKDAVLTEFGYDIFPVDPDQQRQLQPRSQTLAGRIALRLVAEDQ